MEYTEVEWVGDFDWNDRRRHFDSLKDSPQFILKLDSVAFTIDRELNSMDISKIPFNTIEQLHWDIHVHVIFTWYNDSAIQSLHNTVNNTKWLHYISPFSGYRSYTLFTVLPSLGLGSGGRGTRLLHCGSVGCSGHWWFTFVWGIPAWEAGNWIMSCWFRRNHQVTPLGMTEMLLCLVRHPRSVGLGARLYLQASGMAMFGPHGENQSSASV